MHFCCHVCTVLTADERGGRSASVRDATLRVICGRETPGCSSSWATCAIVPLSSGAEASVGKPSGLACADVTLRQRACGGRPA